MTTTQIDPRNMIASVGWVVEDGIADEPFDFSIMEDSFDDWMECQPPEVVDADEGIKRVLEYAQEMDASKKELVQLEKKLNSLVLRHHDQTFFLYGIESDLSLGVIPEEVE